MTPLVPTLAASNAPTAGLGLLVFLALAAACVFLFRSMNKQLKKVPDRFEEERLPEPADPADDALALQREHDRQREHEQRQKLT